MFVQEENPSRLRRSDENVLGIQQVLGRSPRKSTRRARLELAIPHTTIWNVKSTFEHEAISITTS